MIIPNNLCIHLRIRREPEDTFVCGRTGDEIMDRDFFLSYCAVKGTDGYCEFAEEMERKYGKRI